LVALQSGDTRVVDEPGRLPQSRQRLDVCAASDGFIGSTQCEQLGIACVMLGGGREKKEDAVDPAVGLVFHARIGDAIQRGQPLCTLHYNSPARLDEARRLAETAYRLVPEMPQIPPLIHRVIGL